MEMNLSETAFVRRQGDDYELRWFTPASEVDLCGHATLASAHVLWTTHLAPPSQPIRFHTRSGVLTCSRSERSIELDFPALPAQKVAPPAGLLEALGVDARFVGQSHFDYLVVLPSPQTLRLCRPDFARLSEIRTRGILITAASDDPQYDFLSRAFFPLLGVNEDPVCGSAHCTLAEYWGEQLGKRELLAYQASTRGGVVRMRRAGDRVTLGGQAVTVWAGELV
jgi:PhzF family phenazine biosynthesis protein